jgi:DNA topoisomerase VI B subunit
MSERITAEELAKDMREISVAEFFERNKHFLGYENPTKGLLTVVKEMVDNAIEFSTEAGILPKIKVKVKQLTEDRFKVVVEDNGPGVVPEKLPMAFAKVLYGSRFHVLKQSRSLFGIGIKGACLYSQLTTGKPIKVTTGIGKGPIHHFELMIDVAKNEPKIISHTTEENPKNWHGVRVEMEVEGRYISGGHSILNYLKQTAMANPFATIIFDGPDGKFVFKRVTNKLPPKSKEIKPHPYGIELGILRRMLSTTQAKNLIAFLTTEFSRVGKRSAMQICKKAKIDVNRLPKSLTHEESERLYKAMQSVKLRAPPTDCLSPLGEELLIEGLKKEVEAEYFVATTRPPTVYKGMPFQVECVTGDTQIILEDGKILPIKYFVENKIKGKVYCMDKNLKITPQQVLATHKIPLRHELFKIKTRTGREITLTHNNEVPIIKNGKIEWAQAKDIKKGDFIAVPRQIKINGIIPKTLDLLEEEVVKVHDQKILIELLEKLKAKFGSYKRAAEMLKIDYNIFKGFRRKKSPTRPTLAQVKKMCELIGSESVNFEDIKLKIRHIAIVDNKFYNPVKIKIPSQLNSDLLYVLGLINSDGYLLREDWLVGFTNTDKKLLETFRKKVEKIFGIKCKKSKNYCYFNNKTAFIIIEKTLNLLPVLHDNLIISWLKGIADGDGWVGIRKNGKLWGVGIATAKLKEAKLVQHMLLRLGIISRIVKQKPGDVGYIGNRKIETKKPKYNIEIRDLENIKKFSKLISFRQQWRKHRLEIGLKKRREERSSFDVIPVGNLLKEIRINLGLKQYELGFSDDSIRSIEKGRQNITRKHFQQIAERLNAIDCNKYLNNLAFSDILWDRIVTVRKIKKATDYVYDLTTEVGNFVANGVVIHNCGLAYGGKLPLENALIFRFANKVPLFYHQSDCVITEAIKEVDWHRYGISQSQGQLPNGPLAILVHFASVWVPFTSEGKQAIAAYPEILKEIKLALQDAGRKLASYIRKKAKLRESMLRRQIFERYLPVVAESVGELTNKKAEEILNKLKTMVKGETDESEGKT